MASKSESCQCPVTTTRDFTVKAGARVWCSDCGKECTLAESYYFISRWRKITETYL